MARGRYYTCVSGLYSFHLKTENVPKSAHKLCIDTAKEVNFTNSQVFHLQFHLYKMKKKIYYMMSSHCFQIFQ